MRLSNTHAAFFQALGATAHCRMLISRWALVSSTIVANRMTHLWKSLDSMMPLLAGCQALAQQLYIQAPLFLVVVLLSMEVFATFRRSQLGCKDCLRRGPPRSIMFSLGNTYFVFCAGCACTARLSGPVRLSCSLPALAQSARGGSRHPERLHLSHSFS
jgi:hypothetical protein